MNYYYLSSKLFFALTLFVLRLLRISNNISEVANQDLDVSQETRNDDNDVRNMMQSQSSDIPIASYSSSSSNNVMNTNLSGSLKRFNRHLQPNINENDSDDEAENYHDCSGASHTIFAPISSSQPIINPFDEQTAMYSRNEAGTSHQRIAVAALPNLDFDPMTQRTFSASTPSINSQHQPSDSTANSTDENGQHRRDFIRKTTASSSNYFV